MQPTKWQRETVDRLLRTQPELGNRTIAMMTQKGLSEGFVLKRRKELGIPPNKAGKGGRA